VVTAIAADEETKVSVGTQATRTEKTMHASLESEDSHVTSGAGPASAQEKKMHHRLLHCHLPAQVVHLLQLQMYACDG